MKRVLTIIGVSAALAVPASAQAHAVTLDFSGVVGNVSCNYPGCTHDHADKVIGNDWFNRFEGGPGQDILRGDGDQDSLWGVSGDDEIFGGGGNDFISGGWGDDVINCGSGTDQADGGPGIDTFNECEDVLG